MDSIALLVKTVENFLEHVDYCYDQYDKKGESTIRMDDWYLKLNKAVDEVYREEQGLPPRPISGRPRGSRDKSPRKHKMSIKPPGQ